MKNLTGLAGPLYFVLIAVELWAAKRRGRKLYRLNDAINNMSTGIMMQLAVLSFGGVIIAGYIGVYEALRLSDWSPARTTTWLACFLAVDFAYYWFHRLSHEVNFLWAAHVVHHQSEDYNLAVALRQSSVQPFFSSLFYLPLALAGFPPSVFVPCAAINTIYQFWLHTQMIGSLGPLEKIFVTPSHHRVHHGRNPIYIDRNHGGTFIVWDRLFGTFQREEEEVVYGITKPLASWNPLWANLHYWVELAAGAREAQAPLDKLRMFLKAPGWFPEAQGGVQQPPAIEREPARFDRPYPCEVGEYALLQFALLLLVTLGLLFAAESRGPALVTTALIAVCWGLVNLGGLFEMRAWSYRSELARVVLAPLAPLALLPAAPGAAWAALLGLGLVFFWLRMRGLRGLFRPQTPERPAP